MEKLRMKSEILFAILFILIYVVGNSMLYDVSDKIGIEMSAALPLNILVLIVLGVFIVKNGHAKYYRLCKPQVPAKNVLFYIPFIILATVNVWFGFVMNKPVPETVIYILAMFSAGACEELIFRGLLFNAMAKKNTIAAIIVTSITFGLGHIVNLFNGSGMEFTSNLCQLFYAVSIGFVLCAVMYKSQSLISCIIMHAVFNALSVFANAEAFDKYEIPVCIALCAISALSSVYIFTRPERK